MCVNSIAPMAKSPRQVAKEEYQYQKNMDNLKIQHENGEISDTQFYLKAGALTLGHTLDRVSDENNNQICYYA